MKQIQKALETTINQIVLGGLIGAIIIGCLRVCNYDIRKPRGFTTMKNHFYGAEVFANAYHNGVKKLGDDFDFDKDGKNDLYLITKDGGLYHTSSKKPWYIPFHTEEKSWRKDDVKILVDLK